MGNGRERWPTHALNLPIKQKSFDGGLGAAHEWAPGERAGVEELDNRGAWGLRDWDDG
jgi:hypothetical protein